MIGSGRGLLHALSGKRSDHFPDPGLFVDPPTGAKISSAPLDGWTAKDVSRLFESLIARGCSISLCYTDQVPLRSQSLERSEKGLAAC